jgi:hypothetical protein
MWTFTCKIMQRVRETIIIITKVSEDCEAQGPRGLPGPQNSIEY